MNTSPKTYVDMVKCLAKSPEEINKGLLEAPNKTWLIHAALGISGEIAEIVEVVESLQKDDSEKKKTQLLRELGDLMFYCVMIAHSQNCLAYESEDILLTIQPRLATTKDLVVAGGSVIDIVKKHALFNGELKDVALISCIDDILSMALSIAQTNGLGGMQEIMNENYNKLSIRYKGLKYSDRANHERVDKKIIGE